MTVSWGKWKRAVVKQRWFSTFDSFVTCRINRAKQRFIHYFKDLTDVKIVNAQLAEHRLEPNLLLCWCVIAVFIASGPSTRIKVLLIAHKTVVTNLSNIYLWKCADNRRCLHLLFGFTTSLLSWCIALDVYGFMLNGFVCCYSYNPISLWVLREHVPSCHENITNLFLLKKRFDRSKNSQADLFTCAYTYTKYKFTSRRFVHTWIHVQSARLS